jgi:hypothetical protein
MHWLNFSSGLGINYLDLANHINADQMIFEFHGFMWPVKFTKIVLINE